MVLIAALVCKSDPERKHSLKCVILESNPFPSAKCFIYIPSKTLWHAYDNKEGKNPNDYCIFEVGLPEDLESLHSLLWWLQFFDRLCSMLDTVLSGTKHGHFEEQFMESMQPLGNSRKLKCTSSSYTFLDHEAGALEDDRRSTELIWLLGFQYCYLLRSRTTILFEFYHHKPKPENFLLSFSNILQQCIRLLIPKICKHDVFLSFRGEDTRRTFVSHFFNALKQRGIHAFKDDERLETGKSISGELLKAIEESRFAIVIFSKKYASSRWCLEELAHIIKCKNELDQIVIPVFYDVSPSNVSHQNAPFAKSFSKHEKNYKDDLEKVQRWRDAFSEARKISGYHLQNFKDEAYCIKKLVDDIFPKSLQVISPFPESLVGTKSLVEKVTSLLDRESNDVCSIGIWGMGGIGKT
ncbi:TMV resistance protein N-like [Lycium ferocissimum]|uniref:TMV resistance protein N-like n=1 Tax=Lycium ferocissimum TaxID=112874 RepID=UPI0028168D28|nr:TMV resistance protein N-like [Lycium ferocissimum]